MRPWVSNASETNCSGFDRLTGEFSAVYAIFLSEFWLVQYYEGSSMDG
jgi:hypothetical protein